MAEIIYCPNCNEPLRRGTSVCPVCQYQFEINKGGDPNSNDPSEANRRKVKKISFAKPAVLILSIILSIFILFRKDRLVDLAVDALEPDNVVYNPTPSEINTENKTQGTKDNKIPMEVYRYAKQVDFKKQLTEEQNRKLREIGAKQEMLMLLLQNKEWAQENIEFIRYENEKLIREANAVINQRN